MDDGAGDPKSRVLGVRASQPPSSLFDSDPIAAGAGAGADTAAADSGGDADGGAAADRPGASDPAAIQLGFDEIRLAWPTLGFAIYAFTPGEPLTLEVHDVDGKIYTFMGKTAAQAIAAAFPQDVFA